MSVKSMHKALMEMAQNQSVDLDEARKANVIGGTSGKGVIFLLATQVSIR